MDIKNSAKKGELFDVVIHDNRIFLVGTAGGLDISNLLTEEESDAVRLLGKALAIAVDSEHINLVLNVNYHTHSEFSILDGMSRVKDIAKKSSGVSAITEHGNMYSMLKWQTEMKKLGKKAIFGCEVYAESMDGSKDSNHLLFLAKDEIGKQNLFALVSNAYANFHRKPHVSYEEISNHHEGIICTSACIGGEISRKLLKGDYAGAKAVAQWLKGVFGEDFYLEIQRHGISDEDTVNPLILQLGEELGIKVLAANDSHYIDKEDAKAHEMLLCINTGSSIRNPKHFKFEGGGYHFLTDLEMVELFKDIPYAVANTLELAKKCNMEIELGKYHFPKFDIPSEYASEEAYLDALIEKGFAERFSGTPHFEEAEYRERIAYEKEVIISMGFAGYFLIVWDYIRFAKENGIYVGPGRGSAVGSLACYCLGITDLDPIRYNLLFERFLNPERISMPDIDVDFEFERREEVVNYAREKYGEECVSRIITFGNMNARSALQDASRALLGDYRMGDTLSKAIPKGVDMSLTEALEIPDFKAIVDSDLDAKKVFEEALKIEGNKRQTSVHACGVIIADAPVSSYMPTAIIKNKNGEEQAVTQIEEVEPMGLLKMDFLGLRNMFVIANTFRGSNARRASLGQPTLEHWRHIPLNDPYPYISISEGNCHAVFQIEGEGMRKFMKQLFSDVPARIQAIESKYGLQGFEFVTGDGDNNAYKAEMSTLGDELFERMIAGISLYRPGPMDYIPDYINGMLNPEEIEYNVPQLEPILKATYGVICYQEQVMQIVRELAGFSMPQADHIRKAMGKKKQEILDEYKPYFIEGSGNNLDDHGNVLNIVGCVANGIDKEVAEAIWDKMKDFAKYAFNKSHAAGYAVITVTCAWQKYYYPDIYMAAQLNAYITDAEKLKGYLAVAKNLGITILPPDVNKSNAGFIVESPMMIRFGFSGLKGLSKNSSVIENERAENGSYTDFVSFVTRLQTVGVNKKAFEAIINAGGCDGFKLTRATMLTRFQDIIDKIKTATKKQAATIDYLFAVDDVFDEISYEIEDIEEFPMKKLLEAEKAAAGVYLSGSPIDEYSTLINKMNCSEIGLFDFEEDSCTFAGVITEVRQMRTKKDNKPMAGITIEDRSGNVPVVIFNKVFENCYEHLEEDSIVVVKGKPNIDPIYGTQVIAESVTPIDTLVSASVSSVMVRLDAERLEELTTVLRHYEGDIPAWGYVNNSWMKLASVKACSPLFLKLQTMFGVSNVAYK